MTFVDQIKSMRYRYSDTYPYRAYFNRYRCIFVHIPKCAGSSILKLLSGGKKYYRDHADWFDFYRHDPYKFNDYYKFTVVRNPFDRIASTYFYFLAGGNGKEDLRFQSLLQRRELSFETFVLEYLDEFVIHEHLLLRPQYLFVYDWESALKVDYVARFEALDKEMEIIGERLQWPMRRPETVNASKRPKNIEELFENGAVAERVIKLYRKDFELFGYETKVR